MKTPVDPNEPMFPVRPNEPVCQYYMKHGTCKFGQACKFHHPPQSSVTAALVGGGTVFMNVGRKNDVPQFVLPGDGSNTGTPMMLQFLPQRPDEQDCIYFLKNGRCKYWATCRYHHPINFHQRRHDDGRSRQRVQQLPEGLIPQQQQQQQPNLQFINQSGSPHLNYQQGHAGSGAPQMLVTDGNGVYMTLDGSSKGSYQPLSVVSNDGYRAPTGVPLSQNPEHASSTSSIASSYGTANSNLEHLGSHTEPSESSGLWKRQKNNGSHASLNAYDSSSGRTQLTMGTRATSDGSIASRRHRAASYGSASDGSVYIDANLNRSATSGTTLPTSNSSSSMRGWRNERSASFDNTRRAVPSHYRPRGGDISNSNSAHDGVDRSSPNQQGPHRRTSGGVDDGLTMMTSALLTMLDTPEEASADGYDYDYYDERIDQPGGHYQLPPQGMVNPSVRIQDSLGPNHREMMNRPPRDSNQQGQGYRLHGQASDHDMFDNAIHSPVMQGRYEDPRAIDSEESPTWLPQWQASKSVGRPMEGNAQSMSVMQSRHAAPPNSPHSTSNVGLFLP